MYKYYNTNLGILSKEIAIFGKCTIFFVIFTRIRTVNLPQQTRSGILLLQFSVVFLNNR